MTTVSNVGTEVDFNLAQGTDFSYTLTMYQSDGVTPLDITEYTFTADIKLAAVSTEVYATMTCAIVSGPDGTVSVSLAAADSAQLPAGDSVQGTAEGTYVWDLKAVSGTGLTTRPYFGTITMQAEVTP